MKFSKNFYNLYESCEALIKYHDGAVFRTTKEREAEEATGGNIGALEVIVHSIRECAADMGPTPFDNL
jgi:hypothetical protein